MYHVTGLVSLQHPFTSMFCSHFHQHYRVSFQRRYCVLKCCVRYKLRPFYIQRFSFFSLYLPCNYCCHSKNNHCYRQSYLHGVHSRVSATGAVSIAVDAKEERTLKTVYVIPALLCEIRRHAIASVGMHVECVVAVTQPAITLPSEDGTAEQRCPAMLPQTAYAVSRSFRLFMLMLLGCRGKINISNISLQTPVGHTCEDVIGPTTRMKVLLDEFSMFVNCSN